MATDQRRATGQGNADIQVVRVLLGSGAEHAVGVDHGVGFGPDDLFAGLRCAVEQVGRTGETELRAHRHIGIAQGTGGDTESRIDAQFAPAALVHGNGIEGGRDANARAPLHQLFGKAQARRSRIDAAVDMRLGHVQQGGCTLQFGHLQDDPHGHLRGLAILAVQQGQVVFAEFDAACRRLCLHRCGRCLPVIAGCRVEKCQGGAFDPGKGLAAQGGEGLPADAQHRQGTFENHLGHQHAEGEDFIRFGQHQRRRRMTVADQLHHDAAAGTGTAAAG